MKAEHVFHKINCLISYMTSSGCRELYGKVYLCLIGIFSINLDVKLSIRIADRRLCLGEEGVINMWLAVHDDELNQEFYIRKKDYSSLYSANGGGKINGF